MICVTRLIDANALREDWLQNGENEYVYDANAFIESIDDAPTVDAVEVVRCKECLREKHCKNVLYQGENGYCSLGERICDECVECDYYWANSDSEFECQGQTKPCHEFIPKRGL